MVRVTKHTLTVTLESYLERLVSVTPEGYLGKLLQHLRDNLEKLLPCLSIIWRCNCDTCGLFGFFFSKSMGFYNPALKCIYLV